MPLTLRKFKKNIFPTKVSNQDLITIGIETLSKGQLTSRFEAITNERRSNEVIMNVTK